MNIPYVMKKCTYCGRWLVASKANFYKEKSCKYGLYSKCKECCKKQQKQYHQNNREKVLEYQKQYYKANKDKERERNKRYREDNKERVAKKNKQWREANKDKVVEYRKQYREVNKEKLTEQQKQYRQSPQGQAVQFNAHNKRRHKKATQGTGVTGEQWREMMQYFNWRCAYTGKRLTDKTRSGDHIVPIDAGGDDMVWNMVPMLRNLNSSKQAKNMLEWYKEQDFYDPKRLQKIYEWQEYAYNKWGKDTEYFNTNDIQIKLI